MVKRLQYLMSNIKVVKRTPPDIKVVNTTRQPIPVKIYKAGEMPENKGLRITKKSVDIPQLPYEFINAINNTELNNYDGAKIFFMPDAIKDIERSFKYGQPSETGRDDESSGAMAGNIYRHNNQTIAIIHNVIPYDEYAERTPTDVTATLESRGRASERIARINANRGTNFIESGIGWLHTHPNNLPAFFSPTDIETHKNQFNSEFGFSVVIAPNIINGNGQIGQKVSYHKMDPSNTRPMDCTLIDVLSNNQLRIFTAGNNQGQNIVTTQSLNIVPQTQERTI